MNCKSQTPCSADAPWSKAEIIRACDKVLATIKTTFSDAEKLMFIEGAMRELKTDGRVYPLPPNAGSHRQEEGTHE